MPDKPTETFVHGRRRWNLEDPPTNCSLSCTYCHEHFLFFLICCGASAQLGPRQPHFLRFCTTYYQTHRYTGRTHLNEWSACRRGRCLQKTQQTQETNIHAFSRIRTRDPIRADSDLRRRSHGRRIRPIRNTPQRILYCRQFVNFAPPEAKHKGTAVSLSLSLHAINA
jgi:hypothetical protein